MRVRWQRASLRRVGFVHSSRGATPPGGPQPIPNLGPYAGSLRRRTPATCAVCALEPGSNAVSGPAGDSKSDGKDLAAVVRAADRARGVRKLRRLALRAGNRRHGRGLPVGPARAGVAARHLALGDSHGLLLVCGQLARLAELAGQVKLAQSGPTRVVLLMAVISRQIVPRGPTFGAQSWAVLATHRVDRKCEHYGIPQHRLQVDQIVLDPSDFVFLSCLHRGAVLVCVQLRDVDDERVVDRAQA